jgi:2-desacetyl-2-hydroxyethyl bacteriochlorophyllide A dehydrogenase
MSKTIPMAMVKELGRVEFDQRPMPRPGPGQVLIKTRAVSICGSDLHTFHGKHPFAPLPAALGHELSGEIVELGPEADKVSVGDRVVLEPVIICRQCQFCARGDYHLCANISFHHRQGQGAFTPYFVAGQHWVHKLPDRVSFAQGALVEPLAVALHALGRADIKMGQSVAVFGAGAIGQLLVMLARNAGAGDIYVVDLARARLEQALALGANQVFNNQDGDALEAIVQASGGLGVDIAFEAVGLPVTLNQALASLQKGGTAVLVGLMSQPEAVIPSNLFVAKEATLKGSQGYCRDFQVALKFLANKTLDIEPLITHRLPPEKLQEGFELLGDPAVGACKVVIEYPDKD